MGYIDYILYGAAFTALCGFLWYMLGGRAKKAHVDSPSPA